MSWAVTWLVDAKGNLNLMVSEANGRNIQQVFIEDTSSQHNNGRNGEPLLIKLASVDK